MRLSRVARVPGILEASSLRSACRRCVGAGVSLGRARPTLQTVERCLFCGVSATCLARRSCAATSQLEEEQNCAALERLASRMATGGRGSSSPPAEGAAAADSGVRGVSSAPSDERALLFTSFDRRPDALGGQDALGFGDSEEAEAEARGLSGVSVAGAAESEARALRVVGSFGDSTWFGADLDAARAAAEATAAAAQALPLSEKYKLQFERVRELLMERRLFTDEAVQTYLSDYYNNLGLNEFYFQTAAPERIADNLLAVIAAKTLHLASKSDYFPEIIQIDEASGDVFTMAMASLTNRKASQNYKVEKRIEREYLNLDEPRKPCMRMQCYRSSGSVFAENERDTERIRTYFLQTPKYPFDAEEVRACAPAS